MPDSRDLRVSAPSVFESGVPPARDRLVRGGDSDAALDQLEQVLIESTRAEANLGLLLRGLRHLTAGATAAHEANAVLMQELDALRTRIAKVYESESLLKLRVQALENAVDNAARERESWLVQEDAFLVGLLDDHEQKLFDIERMHERRLAELDLELEEMRLQRDSARTEVTRLSYERDAAVALLNEPIIATERHPTPLPAPAEEYATLGAIKLTKQALKPKPDLASRPLVGYSSAGGEDAQGAVDTIRPPQKEP